MRKQENNYAFIDSQNLYLATKGLGWKLDYKRFRVYLKEKYAVEKAYMFLGYLAENQQLYKFLQEDVDLALHLLVNLNNYNKSVVVTGDGDFCWSTKRKAPRKDKTLRGSFHRNYVNIIANCDELSRILSTRAAVVRIALMKMPNYK